MKAPGRLGRVECHLDGGFLAGADRTLGELGYRAAAGGDHVEDHYGRIAAVLAREGMAHTAVGFADRAEIPGVGGKDQLCLCRRCESAKGQECEEDMSSCRQVLIGVYDAKVHFLKKNSAIILQG